MRGDRGRDRGEEGVGDKEMRKEIGDGERQSREWRGETEAERRERERRGGETVSGSLSNSAHILFTDIQATGGDR